MRFEEDAARLRRSTLALLASDVERGARLRLRAGPLHADFSRQLIDSVALDQLLRLADQIGLQRMQSELAAGEALNSSEGRAALHHSLRAEVGDTQHAAVAAHAQSEATRAAGLVQDWVARLRAEGFGDGRDVREVVNIGIGGSDLGPRLLADALGTSASAPRLHFVSSIDAHRAADLIGRLDPAHTAVVLVSKSFGTEETLLNGNLFIDWLSRSLGVEAMCARVFAVTANVPAAQIGRASCRERV